MGIKSFSKVSFEWENRKRYFRMPFPVEEYEERIRKVREKMKESALDCLLVYGGPGNPGHIRYLTNFVSNLGHTFLVLPLEGDPMLATNSVLHGEPMHTLIWMTWVKNIRPAHFPATVRKPENIVDFVEDFLREGKVLNGRLGIVGEKSIPHFLMMDLNGRTPKTQWLSGDSAVMDVRAIKSPRELEVMKKAAWITSRGLDAAIRLAQEGVTELELEAEAHRVMVCEGAEGIHAPMAMTSGPYAGIKHVPATSRKLQKGDMIFMDIGIVYGGYLSDVCRVMSVGKPSERQKRLLEVAKEMEEAVIDATRAGVRICDLQKVSYQIAKKAGHENDYFPSGFGHGIGVSMAERPVLFDGSEEVLQANMVFALEPMIVIEGFGTFCFEDMVVVKERGAEQLSDAVKRTW